MKQVIGKDETILIATFACLGKTTFAKTYPDVAIDIESIFYVYNHEVTPEDEETAKSSDLSTTNANFPANYVSDVVKNMKKYKFVFLTLSQEILAELDKLDIKYTILYPTEERRAQIVEDSIKRGNRGDFVEMIGKMLDDDTHHDKFKFKSDLNYDAFEYLEAGDYIEDYIQENYEYER